MSLVPAGFIVLRTPLLTYDDWLSWANGDRPRTGLRELIARADVREALFVASPDLEATIDSWLENPDTERGQRVERALARYLTRMSTRPTPFGLFAGVSVGTIGDRTRVTLAPRSAYRRRTRLDGRYLSALVAALGRDPTLRESLRYRPNTTIYPAGNRLRYIEVKNDDQSAEAASGQRSKDVAFRREWSQNYGLSDVADTPHIRTVLACAATTATLQELAQSLASEYDGLALETAASYVGELIDNQLLVPELPLPVTGAEPLDALHAALQTTGGPQASAVAKTLTTVRAALAALDDTGLGANPSRYRAIAESLHALPAAVEPSRLFQAELFKPTTEAVFGRSVVAEIARGIELLHRLGRTPVDRLERFRDRFRERYEERAVPLAEVLDEENGIGFDGGGHIEPLLRTLDLGATPARDPDVPWGKRETLLLTLLGNALANGARELVLEPSDVDALATAVTPAPLPLPRALGATATVAASSADAIDRGEYTVYVGNVDGPSGARLLGRFCHGDQELCRHVVTHLRAEETLDADSLYAEIVHSPAGRVDNILGRPLLREREIVYLGDSGAPRDRQITITDLMVSLEAGRIVLRTAADGRRVVPRLTSAHNYSLPYNLATYRFLCALQTEGNSGGASWNWGPLSTSPFLPRVRVGRILLALARWHVTQKEVRALAALRGVELLEEARRWRERRRLPRHIAVVDYDNVLPLDLDSAFGVETFVHLAKEREDGVTLEELFPDPEKLWVRGPEGRFSHELIVPFVTSPESDTTSGRRPHAVRRAPPVITRRFAPGSEWLFAKLYGGPATADRTLRRVVGPLVRRARQERWADRWFFIRYADPDPHLRIRFHGDPTVLRDGLLASLYETAEPLLADGSIWRVQLDTYEREVERYGGDAGIELVEKLFEVDSDAVLEIVERAQKLNREDRWRVTLSGIDLLLADLGFDVAERRAIVRRAGEVYRRDYRIGAKLGRQIGERFRTERRTLEALLAGEAPTSTAMGIALKALHERSTRLAPIVRELQALDAERRLVTQVVEIAPSLTHMFAIRLLRADARIQEVVLYDFLDRLYDARAARERQVGGR